MTDAFQRSASAGNADWQFDPENRLLARGPRIRLTAEQIRDNALYLGGLLNVEQIGRGAKTYQPPNIWEPVGFAAFETPLLQAGFRSAAAYPQCLCVY